MATQKTAASVNDSFIISAGEKAAAAENIISFLIWQVF